MVLLTTNLLNRNKNFTYLFSPFVDEKWTFTFFLRIFYMFMFLFVL